MHSASFIPTATLCCLLHTTMTTSHMLLATPARFPSQLTTTTWNGPLNTTLSGSHSDFPCHLGSMPNTYALCSVDGAGKSYCIDRTTLTPGTNFTMSFIGQSVHGGGSCQLSLTKDLEPTKQSVWKVIQSVVGGCPARDTPGNIGADNDYTAPDASTYDFEVPDGLEEGEYTFAWTWFNKVGNREMYMNCAPVTVGSPQGISTSSSTSSGTSSSTTTSTHNKRDSTFFDNLPNMFLANIPDVPNCASPPSGQNMLFPNAGLSVEHNNAGDVFAQPVISNNANCYAPLAGKAAAAVPPSSTISRDGSASASTIVTTSTILVSPTPATATSLSAAGPPITPTQSAAITSASPAISCSGISVSCPSPGTLICVTISSFGLCDLNNCAVPQDVATGTVCQNGMIVKRDVLTRRDLLIGSNGRGGMVYRERAMRVYRG
jgi:hypothetical protein